jgi:hypothetical protein
VGSNIPVKIKWMELGNRDEFPGQEVEIVFHPRERDILALGDQNQHWKIRKNKLPF